MAAAQGEVVKSSFSSFEGFMSFVQLLLSRVVWWLWRSSSVPTSVVAFVAPLGFCLLGCWALVVVGGVMVFVGEVVLLGGRRWRAVPDAGKTMAGLVLAGLVVTSGGFPTESPTALQMGLLAVGMMVVEAVMSGSLRAVLVADGLARAGCAAGFTLLVVTAVRTGQVAWAVPAVVPAVAHHLISRRVLLTRERARSTAERLPRLPRLMAAGRTTAAELAAFVGDLRQTMGADVLWLHTPLPSGTVWAKASDTGTVHHDRYPTELDPFTPPASGTRPQMVTKKTLPAGWRAGVHVPLQAPDGQDAGYLLMGWKRLNGPYLASWMITGVLAIVITSTARALGAFWMNLWTTHELQDERARLSAAIDHSDVAILALDTSGHIVVWNTAMANMTGISPGEAIGCRTTELFTLKSEDGTVIDLTDNPSGTPTLTIRDGRTLWVEISCSSSADPTTAGLLTAVFVDKSAERQLDYMRHLLLVSVHHELHGPLTTIRGHAQLLNMTTTDQDGTDSCEAILDAVEMMQHVITDLVHVIEGNPTARPTATDKTIATPNLLRKTVQSLPAIASRTRIHTPTHFDLRGDPVRLRQCLLIILTNAEKYAATGPITITTRKNGDCGIIEITDQGPGIPDTEKHLVLKPYYRSPTTKNKPGSGLGLHIANVLITSMHGHINLTTPPTGGLRISLSLPLATARTPHQH
ncbi:ATP-binding protein [Actinoallomurus sp. NBC_01490]|uniref:ATP-binding protein n=1 Tax=Actinoallomurus sp. NBC_01490 TaxID=2903557 RepID=UPI002E347B31|nr:ATP-binding protein [Actinoallomurus sp. NBC_01490]